MYRPLLVAFVVLTTSCSAPPHEAGGGGGGGSSGWSPGGGLGGAGGSAGSGGESGARVKDCGVHSTIGSCGPVSDNCHCGSSCLEFGVGSYQCVWSCTTDADCSFDVRDPAGLHPWNGRCVTYNSRRYCQVLPPPPPGCLDESVKISCNPLTNNPCAGDESCDLGETPAGFALSCYPPPNLAGPGDACDNENGPFCVGGYHCTRGICRSFCCSSSDCGGRACQAIDSAAGRLGTCE